MANVNDVRRFGEKVAAKVYEIKDDAMTGRIDSDDADAILAAHEHYRFGDWEEPSTQHTNLRQLHQAAENAAKPLLAFDSGADIKTYLGTLEGRGGGPPARQTERNHANSLKKFFEYLQFDPDRKGFGDFEWVRWYDVPSSKRKAQRIRPEQIPDPEHVEAVRRHARYQRTGAVVELMADIGGRAAQTSQLKVGNLDVTNDRITVRPNPDGASQKGVEEHPMTGEGVDLDYSEVFVRRWLREGHEEAPDPPADAPLFCVLKGYDPDDRENCAAHPKTIEDQIRFAYERALDAGDIDADRAKDLKVGPHMWKHAAVKRMRAEGMSWESIGNRVLWSDYSVSNMMSIYGALDAKKRKDKIREERGEALDTERGRETRDCRKCGTTNEAHRRYCIQCEADFEASPDRARSLDMIAEGLRGLVAEEFPDEDPEEAAIAAGLKLAMQSLEAD